MKRILLLLLLGWMANTLKSQTYTTAQAHSHNDYEQAKPFYLAYTEKYGSIEADIHLVSGLLLVGHDQKDLQPEKTLSALYLDPLNKQHPVTRPLQLLIDIKTEARPTLDTLLSVLKRYPLLIQNSRIKIVVSGNRPPEEAYTAYPAYVWFDGRLGREYSPQALSKIALLSESIQKYTGLQQGYPAEKRVDSLVRAVITSAHAAGKPVRFWATPDTPEAWKQLIDWRVDYINTDHIVALRDFLLSLVGPAK